MDKAAVQEITKEVKTGTSLRLTFKRKSDTYQEITIARFCHLIDNGFFGFQDEKSFMRLIRSGALNRWNRIKNRIYVVTVRKKFKRAQFVKYLGDELESVEIVPS